MLDDRLRFDLTVRPGGYLWWYFDAESADGAHALTIIAFIGSVFSPYYAWSGRASPAEHCALNVALYGPPSRWAMTERSSKRIAVTREKLEIGASGLSWQDDALTITIDERGAPLPFPLRGAVTMRPHALTDRAFEIGMGGRHRWRPLAPRASFQVELQEPSLSWKGEGYFDSNDGDEPLEDAFTAWDWTRLHAADAAPLILYDTVPREGAPRRLAVEISPDGAVTERTPPPTSALPATPVFRMPRAVGADGGARPRVLRTLEDAPFYSRSIVETTIGGVKRRGFHESLSGDRLRSPIVRAMLPFRMPRHDF
jgi:carotenoid 1,2-hydratase